MRKRDLPVNEVRVYETEDNIYDYSISGFFLGIDWLKTKDTLLTRFEIACNGTSFDGWLDEDAIGMILAVLRNRQTMLFRPGDFTYDRLYCRRKNGCDVVWLSLTRLLLWHTSESRPVLPLRFKTRSELDSHGTYGCGLVDADSLLRNILLLNG